MGETVEGQNIEIVIDEEEQLLEPEAKKKKKDDTLGKVIKGFLLYDLARMKGYSICCFPLPILLLIFLWQE